jgi:hypothetical protein
MGTFDQNREDFSCMLFRKEIYTLDRHVQSQNVCWCMKWKKRW